jgi:hypothetical protein
MPKFAVYYVPQADDPFYQAGSGLLGYDVRTCQIAVPSPEQAATLGSNGKTWTTMSRPYGFHLTICEALDCHWTAIPRIEQEVTALLGCFDPNHLFVLRQKNDHPIGIWGNEGHHSLVLLYEANRTLHLFHTLLVARLTSFGIGSGFLKRYLIHPEQELPSHSRQQIRLFSSPTVFENWYPHFTLLNPYTGPSVAAMASRLAELFHAYSPLTLQTICLLIQDDNETNWQIYQEFHR